MEKRMLIVVGTRPEAIKLIPLYTALKKAQFKTILCATNQHTDLLNQAFELFGVKPDINLNVMRHDQDLFHITQSVLEKIKLVYLDIKPSLVIVQGDTTTAFCAALGAFYLGIPVAHVEAGLRTGDIHAPFPEELNRKIITQVASYHFAPTALNVANLLAEDVARTSIFCTGNTIVDALFFIKEKIENHCLAIRSDVINRVEVAKKNEKKLVLLTAHRRESFGDGLLNIFMTLKEFMLEHDDVFVFYPYHPNPNVINAIEKSEIQKLKNIYFCEPISYANLVYLLMSVDWVVTDSGGIQEEAVSLGKPVIVLRDVSERVECFWEGMGRLVGSNKKLLLQSLIDFYHNKEQLLKERFIFGDGNAAERIVSILKMKLQDLKEYEDSVEMCNVGAPSFDKDIRHKQLSGEAQ